MLLAAGSAEAQCSTMQQYFYCVAQNGTSVGINHAIITASGEWTGRQARLMIGATDSQPVKAAENGGSRGKCAGVNDRKRHICIDHSAKYFETVIRRFVNCSFVGYIRLHVRRLRRLELAGIH